MNIDINTYNLCKSEKLGIVLETHDIIKVYVNIHMGLDNMHESN